jgi:dTDP-4-amino-4,6-dideoxy-D-galactose acyltransferase
MSVEPVDFLPWDTEFFGLRIGRVRGQCLDEALAVEVDAWSERNAIQCLYLLTGADDPQTTRVAEAHGFNWVDIRLTFERSIQTETAPELPVRLARAEDAPMLQAIAREVHTDTRYFYDTRFPRDRAEALYAKWIALECEGRANAVLVSVNAEDGATGYISCHLNDAERTGQIGLVGLSAETRGQGVGQMLVRAALHWFFEHGVQRVSVVTQGRNRAAQRLYQRTGFLTHTIELWYHKWYSASEGQYA